MSVITCHCLTICQWYVPKAADEVTIIYPLVTVRKLGLLCTGSQNLLY